MQTRLAYCVHRGDDFGELLSRANDLAGTYLEDEPELMIIRILHFQITQQGEFWYVWLLVEVDTTIEIG